MTIETKTTRLCVRNLTDLVQLNTASYFMTPRITYEELTTLNIGVVNTDDKIATMENL